MNDAAALGIHKVLIGMLLAVIFALINLARGNAVAEHFRNIADGHFHGHNLLFDGVVVRPILKMMFVPALVMKPRGAVAVEVSLRLVRTARAEVVLYPLNKFGGRIFGKVVPYPLPEDARAKSVAHNGVAVARNCIKMTDCVFKVVCFHEKNLQKVGMPDAIRTHDLQSRSLTLYPAELRAHIHIHYTVSALSSQQIKKVNFV